MEVNVSSSSNSTEINKSTSITKSTHTAKIHRILHSSVNSWNLLVSGDFIIFLTTLLISAYIVNIEAKINNTYYYITYVNDKYYLYLHKYRKWYNDRLFWGGWLFLFAMVLSLFQS